MGPVLLLAVIFATSTVSAWPHSWYSYHRYYHCGYNQETQCISRTSFIHCPRRWFHSEHPLEELRCPEGYICQDQGKYPCVPDPEEAPKTPKCHQEKYQPIFIFTCRRTTGLRCLDHDSFVYCTDYWQYFVAPYETLKCPSGYRCQEDVNQPCIEDSSSCDYPETGTTTELIASIKSTTQSQETSQTTKEKSEDTPETATGFDLTTDNDIASETSTPKNETKTSIDSDVVHENVTFGVNLFHDDVTTDPNFSENIGNATSIQPKTDPETTTPGQDQEVGNEAFIPNEDFLGEDSSIAMGLINHDEDDDLYIYNDIDGVITDDTILPTTTEVDEELIEISTYNEELDTTSKVVESTTKRPLPIPELYSPSRLPKCANSYAIYPSVDCMKFYKCHSFLYFFTRLTLESCASGQVFSASELACVRSYSGMCLY